ncbi:hypothetical protein Asppvi_003954 [Aspergillus pseudoviridinutans]|uniref:Jacalin-type lectin domain-containing protein n=1 Tax=Aspergillus pseudoviridinutans TaxID=1517512 RepID=A0A9P3B7Z7_9EURO|nr:uncharacterized protein Asppvi_003954 [Aspergillus pseudoviridinutans]GIJ85099.1 hypothetical protein Asppvi_003954 [Aspergillus pseudoviridinutans]
MMQSSHFWTSKLKSEECDFAFEVRELEPSKFVNSRWLYRFICIQRAGSLHNRARIWELGRCLKEILELSEPDTTTIVNNPRDPVGLDWVKLPWPIKATDTDNLEKYIEGCQILYTQRVFLSSRLRQVTASCIDIEGTVYITGLKLSFDDETSTQLGYRSRDNSSADIVAFGGFIVAVSTSGIHGLQIIDEGSDVTKWFGSNKRCPQTRLPPENLRMKEGAWMGQSPAKSRHNLLFWVWFGGPGGSYLQYLTGISITTYRGGFGGIEFHFSSDSVPITSRKLGLCDDKQGPDFAIDGAGGEYIMSVHGKLAQMPYLPALTICTNRGRKFAALRQSFDVAKMKQLFPSEPNSILTGFYTSYRDHDSPLRSLGCLWERS